MPCRIRARKPHNYMKITHFIIAFAAFTMVAKAEETAWTQWRGPLGNGVVAQGNPALEWSETKNLKWKIETPGSGTSTPIVLGNKVFLLTAASTGKKVEAKEPSAAGEERTRERPERAERQAQQPRERAEPPQRDGAREGDRGTRRGRGEGRRRGRGGFGRGQKPDEIHQFSVVCLDRKTGKTLWSKVVKEVLPHEGHHRDHGYASASPVTDGKHLYAYFGSRGLYCLDLDGNVKWEKHFGAMRVSNGFGEGTSPALYGDTLVVKWDHEDDSFIAALDKNTGDELWRQSRDERTSWATPLVVEHAGVKQVIANATDKVASYNLKNGDLIWESTGMTRNVIPTPVAGDGILYAMSGFRGSALQAIKWMEKAN
jgi:outer membrane protein assembly factor BamB